MAPAAAATVTLSKNAEAVAKEVIAKERTEHRVMSSDLIYIDRMTGFDTTVMPMCKPLFFDTDLRDD
jgi:hypothetical protein